MGAVLLTEELVSAQCFSAVSRLLRQQERERNIDVHSRIREELGLTSFDIIFLLADIFTVLNIAPGQASLVNLRGVQTLGEFAHRVAVTFGPASGRC